MKKTLVVLGVLVLMSGAAFAQGTYFVNYFSNNQGATAPVDAWIRVLNAGLGGTPLTSPAGDICANYYVFDNNQEMIECCSCRITPNEYRGARVGHCLTASPLTGVVPTSGVVKIVTTPFTGSCNPTAPLTGADAGLAKVWGTHLQVTGGATYVSEAEKLPSLLSAEEATFLPSTCAFVRYLGSGFGKCNCSRVD
jgi:hypothetical protein